MIKLKRRIGSAALAVMMLLSLMPLTALAANEPKTTEVSTTDGLVAAIQSATAGDIIVLQEGTYDLTSFANKWFNTPVSLQGAGSDKTILEGSLWLGGGNGSVVDTVGNLTIRPCLKNKSCTNGYDLVNY